MNETQSEWMKHRVNEWNTDWINETQSEWMKHSDDDSTD